jgi:hypothetical protein
MEDKQIKPLVSDLPPVLWKAEHMTYDQCSKEGEKLRKQLVTIHSLPKVDGINAMVYMHETLEMMRRRFRELQWRQIELLSAIAKKEVKARKAKAVYNDSSSS